MERFLRSAAVHFMPGQRVIFYIILDSYVEPPDIEPRPLQSFQILMMDEEWWLPSLKLMCLKVLEEHLVSHIREEVDFFFSMDSSLFFQGDFGLETLGTLVAQLHIWWYFQNQILPYERRSSSEAYIPLGQGDFYYGDTILGGTPWQVLDLVEWCLKGMVQDLQNGLNSTFEKYLNKYFFLHKPTKLLSPEYGWDLRFNLPPQVRYIKVAQQQEV